MGLFSFFTRKSNTRTSEILEAKRNNYVSILNEIQVEIHSFLKQIGFRKKGRTFNRETEKGIIQVINIQNGKYEFGGKHDIPELRENHYCKFTINLGVFVSELYELSEHNKPKSIYQEYDCNIRTRLSSLTTKDDFWWTISDSSFKTSQEIISGLKSEGIPWLNLFETRTKICENWGVIEGSSVRANLDVGLIELKLDTEKGSKLIQEYYNSITSHNGHKEYVFELASQLGIELKSKES